MLKEHQNLVIVLVVAAVVTFAFWYNGVIDPNTTTLSSENRSATATSEGALPNTSGDVTTTTTATPTTGAPVKNSATTKPSGKFKEFVRPTGYLNTRQLNILDSDTFLLSRYVGQKVIVLQFLTTSDMSSVRDARYLDHLYKRYDDNGLLVIGIHAPQFIYERNKDAVQKAFDRYGISFPAIMDNEFTTWAAYKNTGWPTTYVIDIYGNIVSTTVGEGDYTALETKLRSLLVERATRLKLAKPVLPGAGAPEGLTVIDRKSLKSKDTYFGSKKNRTLTNGTPLLTGVQDLKISGAAVLNALYFASSWEFSTETAANMVSNAGITYRYGAKNVHLLSSAPSGLVRVDVLRDGKPLTTTEAGKDILFENGVSYFYVKESRFYNIISDKAGYGEHALELAVRSGSIAAYLFTFE